VKYDGYRLRVERDGKLVRLITRGGYDGNKRFPWIVEAASKNRQKHFVIDGEAVILGLDGISDFNALTQRRSAVVWQIHGQGPFAITYVNPADDPRTKSKAAK
jgi:ATP-dependent DNA ligase